MVKRITKFLVIIIISIMLLSPTVMGFTLQGWGVTPPGEGNVTSFRVTNNYGLFCMNHGYHFIYGEKYRVYEAGTVDNLTIKRGHNGDNGLLLSFIIGDMQRAVQNGEKDRKGENINGKYSRNGQEWQEFIWELIGENKQNANPVAYAELEAKYNEYKAIYDIKDKKDEVTIKSPNDDVVVANPEGMIGPFTIKYPYKTKVDEHIDLKITMTDSSTGTDKILFEKTGKNTTTNIITSDAAGTVPFKPGDTEFYFSINDATYGKKYKFKVDWNFTYYDTARYWKLTPPRTLLQYVECDACFDKRLCYYPYDAYLDHNTGNYVNASGTVIARNGRLGLEPVERYFIYSPGDADFVGGGNVFNSETGQVEQKDGFRWIISSGLLPVGPDGLYGVWQGTNMLNATHDHIGRTSASPPDELDNSTHTYIKGPYFADLKLNENENQSGFYNYGGESGYQHGCQDYIFLETKSLQTPLGDEVEVLVGQPNIKIKLNKIDSLILESISGITFEVSSTDSNIELQPDKTLVNPYTFTTDGSEHEITIKPDNEGVGGIINEITVTFKEIGLDDESKYLMYKDENGDPGSVSVTFIWDAATTEWKYKEVKWAVYDNGVEEKAYVEDIEKNSWKLVAENRPKVEELSGYVWIDGVTGEKNIQPPNGRYDGSESYKAGVKVYLFKIDGTQVEYDGYGVRFGPGGEGYLVTGDDGKYEFKDLPKLPDGEAYYIVFEYDGINYIRTILGGESKADEPDRSSYNSKFKTISAGQSNGGISLEYTYDGTSVSTLITENGDGTVLEKFAIKADTQTAGNTYNETTTDINLGITKKVLDLALMTDLHKATASMNGVTPTEIVYNKKFDDALNDLINGMQNKTADGVNYNINLYRSDYNYRIGNYINSPSISHQPELVQEEKDALQASREELKLTLEYIVILSNQSTTDASIDEFEFYFDSHLNPTGISGGQGTVSGNKITIIPDNTNVSNGSHIEVKITFETTNLQEEQVIRNYAEITKYSTTEGGFVDCDSAPGNSNAGSGSFQYEDDSDEAKGVNLKISRVDREISGNVFEDNKLDLGDNQQYVTGNGILDSGENKVDDVIVQLIEVKNLPIGSNTHRLEYIWQETTTGTNIVKKISDDGTKIETVQHTDVTPETGKYVFRGFIPGDYIVRFIYGDGTYYDTAINGNNILKYNGVDYKSTVDEKSNATYLVGSGYSSENSSMARDNEARRLEVMAYSLGVKDGNDLIINNKDKLANTWMAAETSRIVVEDCMIDGVSTFYRRANFGLVEKPLTKLTLKKHIGYAELKDVSGNTIIQASVDAKKQYLDDDTNILNFRDGIAVENAPIEAMATTRQNRGYWQVESNSVDGANLVLIYKYIVENAGEPDFLNQSLMSKFNFTGNYDSDIKTYIEEIKKLANEVKTAVKTNKYNIQDSYLGQAYYTGNKGSSDVAVKTYVNLEDYLKDLSFDSSTQFEVVSNNESKKIINLAGNEAMENVKVIRTKTGEAIETGEKEFDVKVKTTISDKLVFPSYIAQIITPTTSLAGGKITGSVANNLEYVQSYYSVARLEDLGLGKGTEPDEYWAETFRIIPTTGGDKQSSFALVISLTTGLAIIVVGIVLIKKFMIK